jgi:hypothetical protein
MVIRHFTKEEAEIVNSILKALDGLSVNMAKSYLETCAAVIGKTKVRFEDIEAKEKNGPTSEEPLGDL